jgi:hypothetical protein
MFVGTEAYCFTAGRGVGDVNRMLEVLASVKACKDKPFSMLSTLVMERASLLSGCTCILLSWDEERQKLIGRMKALGVPILVLVIQGDRASESLDYGPMEDDPGHFITMQADHIREGLGKL